MRIPYFILLFIFSLSLSAKQTAVYVKFSQFMTDEQETYLEMYFNIAANSLDYVETSAGKLQGGIEVTVQIMQDSNIVAADRFRILSPEFNDTNAISRFLLHQQRFPLAAGEYTVKLDIIDINEAEETYSFAPTISLNLKENQVAASDVLFLESYGPATQGSAYSRSGFDIIPIITSGSYFFPEGEDKLSFYCELYNLDQKLGDNQPYLLKYYLEDAETGTPLNQFASFSKKTTTAVQPVLASFNIAELPTGEYHLAIEVLDREANQVLGTKTFFYRRNKTQQVVEGSFESRDITNTFVDDLGNLDSIYRFVEYLYPISTEREQLLQEGLLAQGDEAMLKRYFLAFWQEKSPLRPQKEWLDYYKKVRYVNDKYSSSLRAGYKSDRGRVYLVYGKPDIIEQRAMEPNLPPYQVWQYNRVNTPFALSQTNIMFVFGEFDPSTQEYQLFHSTAYGEIQNRDWRQALYSRAYGGPGTIDPSSDPNEREFGSRANQSLILSTTGADRQDR